MDNIKIIKSRRKTISIQIKPDLSVEVRAPLRMSAKEINEFIATHESWIREKLSVVSERNKAIENIEKYTAEEINALAEKALEVLPLKVRHYAEIIGVSYGRITVRCQKTRWGSCSGKGNLNFNCLLMLAPDEVIDYVVVHELCHRIELNHSARFWKQVEKILPDYKIREKWLKNDGKIIMLKR